MPKISHMIALAIRSEDQIARLKATELMKLLTEAFGEEKQLE